MTTTCPNKDCPNYQKQLKVKGGCECGAALVRWQDPDIPTIEQIAYIVCDVSRLEGRMVPRPIIEGILHDNPELHKQWMDRLKKVDWKARLNEIHVEDALMDQAAIDIAVGLFP